MAAAVSLMNLSLMPTSVKAPPTAPEAAPSAAPASGIKKMRPISVPQKAPPTAPAVVVLIIWFSLMLPLASFTATTASPSSSRYSFCMPSNFCRTSSAFASVGNAITTRSLGIAPGTVRVLFGWEVGFEDRFQHQHRCCHADPIPHGRDAQRPELAVGFWDEHSSDNPVGSFPPGAQAPVRQATAPRHTSQYPRSPAHLLPVRPGWSGTGQTHGPERPHG